MKLRNAIPVAGLLLITVAAGFWWLNKSPDSSAAVNSPSATTVKNNPQSHDSSSDPVAAFLATHWRDPLPPQGKPPAHFSHAEASLAPETCGQCHQEQFRDWSQSLHSHTMGAGILWQFQLMPQEDANKCMKCHAPLAEQKALVAQSQNWPNAPTQAPPAYVSADLGHQGLVCAGCHVRNHQRFGPEPRKQITGALPHDGFTIAPAFSDGRFCATCHQFPEDGPRTNNKLREDTYAQWQASSYGQAGQQCQSCHMPDRKHQWRGIHDQQMVTKALSTVLVRDENQIHLDIVNTGAGHYFPTYMVPKVTVELRYRDKNEKQFILLAQDVIGWNVDIGLEQELFDTRIPPGAKRRISVALPVGYSEGGVVDVHLIVKPREHYERTFLSVLDQRDKLDAKTLGLLETAYSEAVATQFQFTLASHSLFAPR
jgi:hypothetical protein